MGASYVVVNVSSGKDDTMKTDSIIKALEIVLLDSELKTVTLAKLRAADELAKLVECDDVDQDLEDWDLVIREAAREYRNAGKGSE